MNHFTGTRSANRLIPQTSKMKPIKAVKPVETIDWTELRTTYPQRCGGNPWKRAEKAVMARLKAGATWEELLAGTRRYSAYCIKTGKLGTEFVMQAATFFGPDQRYLEEWVYQAPIDPKVAAQEAQKAARWAQAAQAAQELRIAQYPSDTIDILETRIRMAQDGNTSVSRGTFKSIESRISALANRMRVTQ